ncbi:MutH/Sau3AI family endonuclease [Ectobacillus sp. sgz5001026]|uniref:MutH/Sau3AI family endonuclease n=1 Tax=Ectobacillus sp. sgz5001026 TaxID=3242473 RepID=UPI0036D41511
MTLDLKEIESVIRNSISDLIGLSFEDIAYKVGINPELISTKLSIVTLVNKMLHYKNFDKKQLAEDLKPLQLSIKTIRLQVNGKPKESMSFDQIKFINLVDEEWQNSYLRRKFDTTIFLFVVFQYKQIHESIVLYFKGIKIWKMPQQTLDCEVQKMWADTKRIVTNGIEFTERLVGNRVTIQNNLPCISDNPVAHIRPKAKDSNDTIELPDGQFITKQAYWLNSSYIGEILHDLSAINRRSVSTTINEQRFSSNELIILESLLDRLIYTIEEFFTLVKKVLLTFTTFDINNNLLKTIGYKIDTHFIISNSLKDANEYFENIIFKNDYFEVPENPLFQTPFVRRKIDNFENAYKLLKIEENMFITDTCLKRANVTKDKLVSYKCAVEQSVKSYTFFTLKSLRENGFYHDLEDCGFDNIFYESILKRPGRLKYLKLAKNIIIFIKTKSEVSNTTFFEYLISKNEPYISIDDFVAKIKTKWQINLSYENAINFAKSSDLYYAKELQKIFHTKEMYYQYVYNS